MNKEQRRIKKKRNRAERVEKAKNFVRDKRQEALKKEVLEFRKQRNAVKMQRKIDYIEKEVEERMKNMDPETLKEMEKSVQILKNMEKQYAEERQKRIDLNKSLEEKGFVTFEEKMKHLNEEYQKNSEENES